MKRPWGHWELLTKGDNYWVKALFVEPRESLSLQRHEGRSEHWVAVEGDATVVLGQMVVTLHPNGKCYIPKGMWHQLINETDNPLIVIEVATGVCKESDIERKE